MRAVNPVILSAPLSAATHSSSRAHNAGFTLIELMVTIAVLAIIVSIAAPNISTQLANQRVKSTAAILTNALKNAKVESVIRRQNMTVAYNNNGTASGTITVTDSSSRVVASYQYDAKATLKSTPATTVFKTNKTATIITYTICDSNLAATPRQVAVSTITNISNKPQGSCP